MKVLIIRFSNFLRVLALMPAGEADRQLLAKETKTYQNVYTSVCAYYTDIDNRPDSHAFLVFQGVSALLQKSGCPPSARPLPTRTRTHEHTHKHTHAHTHTCLCLKSSRKLFGDAEVAHTITLWWLSFHFVPPYRRHLLGYAQPFARNSHWLLQCVHREWSGVTLGCASGIPRAIYQHRRIRDDSHTVVWKLRIWSLELGSREWNRHPIAGGLSKTPIIWTPDSWELATGE